jgi:hypothetical protein
MIINDNNIKNIVDLGCGDFICGKIIYDDLDILYTGYDTYKKVVDSNKRGRNSIRRRNKSMRKMRRKSMCKKRR